MLKPEPNQQSAFSWQGVTAIVLAVGVFISVLIITLSQSIKLIHGFDLSPAGIQLLTAVLSSLIGGAGVFLGKVATPEPKPPIPPVEPSPPG